MEGNRKYDIFLPVKNGGELVKKCVESIFSQTYTNFNLIVLDNASTDGTLEWLKSLKDDRIIIYPSNESLSIEQNWGRIITVPKNEFITIIGHDDILHPHYLEEMDRLISRHPDATLYQTHFSFINGNGEFIKYCMPMDEIQYGHEFLACQLTRTMDSMGTGYMMRSRDYDELGGISTGYPNLIFADYQLWVQLTLKNFKATCAKVCFSYRVHDSVSKLTNGEEYQLAFEKYVYFMAALCKENEQVKNVIEKYGHGMLMYFCESLSHRLLKTPPANRKTTVNEFINKCKVYASVLIPGQKFEPLSVFRIDIARKLDNSVIGRLVFNMYKKLAR
jgi:glycosyltransferase involved in cell wall biosynthesis